jgi:hypothetical protein
MPARVEVYYVLGLCLFFGDSYEEVMRLLVAGLHFTGAWQKDWQVPTTGAIWQARQRLGAAAGARVGEWGGARVPPPPTP